VGRKIADGGCRGRPVELSDLKILYGFSPSSVIKSGKPIAFSEPEGRGVPGFNRLA
jgi:hypothetical protein